ncbi:MAG TPA: flavodoxin domain-containing protein [Vicinamibacterales bacterium]|nr:flavodoxin domain-containing protein [Vicinamibacterales bacterium]
MASNILVMYATTHGQAAKIAGEIVASMRSAGATASVGNVVEAWTADPRDYSAVVLVGRVHAGRFPGSLRQWVEQHRSALASRPTAFVAVCLAVLNRSPKVDQDLRAMLDRFTTDTGWQPAETKIVAGALKYTKYGWLTRWMMKRIVAKAGGNVDTSRDFEYTDWDDLRDFAIRFLAGCEGRAVDELQTENRRLVT